MTLFPNEIIFVEAGSTDATFQMLEKWAKEQGQDEKMVKILRNPRGFPGANRNRGVQKSRYPWIAFLDVRTIPRPEWLETIRRLSSTGPEVAWLGKCQMDGATAFSKAVCAVSYGCKTSHISLPGSFFQRMVFREIGFFREDLRSAEDLDWMKKLKASGLGFGICREPTIHYEGFPKNGRELRKKYWIYSQCGISIGHQPSIYLFTALLAVVMTCVFLARPGWAPAAACLYLFFRGVVDPVRRSRKLFWWRPSFKAFLVAPWVALQIDGTKALAYLFQLVPRFGPKA